MMELFHNILVRVTLAGMAGSVAVTLTKDSALREIVRFAAGLLMILALLQPLAQLRLPTLSGIFGKNQTQMQVQTQNEQTARAAFEKSVEDAITRRAAEQGIACTVAVSLQADQSGGYAVERVSVRYHDLDEEQLAALQSMLETACGIPKDRQEMIAE